MTPAINNWALRNGISAQALAELRVIFGIDGDHVMPEGSGVSESAVQAIVRLEAVRKGVRLFRNNVGALLDNRNIPVRFGLANDSKQLNERIKSGDLIGWRPVLITQQHIGYTIAQFVSRECKRPNWRYTATDREIAQLSWAQLVIAGGGDAAFCMGEGTL